MRIVIVDDESIICDGLTRILSDSRDGVCTIVAIYQDAEEALETCDWEKVDLLFIDINMPGMNGLEMVEALRERGWDTLVVIISGFGQFEYARRALQQKAVDFILKPISPESILSAIDKTLGILDSRKTERASKLFIQENLDRLAREYYGELLFETREIPSEQKAQFNETLNLTKRRFTLFTFVPYVSDDFPGIEQKTRLFSGASCYFYSSGTGVKSILVVYDRSIRFNAEVFIDFIQTEYGIFLWHDFVSSNDFHSLSFLHSRFLKDIRDLGINASILTPCVPPTVKSILPAQENFSIPVREALRIIHEEYSKPLSLSILSEKICVHPAYLSNVFKKQTGFSLIEYINHHRVEQAKILLRDPLNKIFWISERVGFANQRYFSQVFKKTTGISPVEYRSDFYLFSGKN